MLRRIIIAVLTVVTAGALSGCGASATSNSGGSSAPAVRALPACTVGHGRDGSKSTLAIHQHGTTFTGVYLNTPPDMPAGTAWRYDVAGTVKDGSRFTSIWTFGNVALHVTGRYTATSIILDNPGGSFTTTAFHAAKNCPGG